MIGKMKKTKKLVKNFLIQPQKWMKQLQKFKLSIGRKKLKKKYKN